MWTQLEISALKPGTTQEMLQILEETPGFAEFEMRRQKKVTKQMAGGAIHNLDDGVDRNLADKTK